MHCFGETKQKEKADDIFQDVFIRLIRLRNRLEGEEHVRAWMIKTTLNCCKDLWKSAWMRHVVYDRFDFEVCEEKTEVNDDICGGYRIVGSYALFIIKC